MLDASKSHGFRKDHIGHDSNHMEMILTIHSADYVKITQMFSQWADVDQAFSFVPTLAKQKRPCIEVISLLRSFIFLIQLLF